MTLFPSVNGHPENITVINPCSKIHSHFYLTMLRLACLKLASCLSMQKNMYVVTQTRNPIVTSQNYNMATVNSSDWNVVPDLVLLNVFFQLEDEDRLSMALVCKNWYRLFQSPQLWRHRRVIFSTEKPYTSATNSLGFLKTFGKNLRVLTVGFAMPNFRNAKQISKAVEFYFNKATNIPDLRLKEFTLQNANMELYWHFILSRKRIISSLCRFLRRLHELTLINLIAAKMSLTDGCRVLESLGRGQASKTLQTVFIEDMFQAYISPNKHMRYTQAMSKFKSISWIYTNYDTINAQIMKNIANCMGEQFQKLTLTIDCDVSSNIIRSEDWNNFAEHCPNAEVVVYIYASAFKQDVPSILVPGIPLKEIDIVSWPSVDSARRALESNISSTLCHVALTYSNRIGSYSTRSTINVYFPSHGRPYILCVH